MPSVPSNFFPSIRFFFFKSTISGPQQSSMRARVEVVELARLFFEDGRVGLSICSVQSVGVCAVASFLVVAFLKRLL